MKKKMLRFTAMKFSFIIVIAATLSLAACSKGGSAGGDDGGVHWTPTPEDTTKPVLDVYTPTVDQVFTSGSSINVSGRITDDYGLYRGSIRITNDANGSLLKEQLYEIHYVTNYNFNINYTPTVSIPSNYTVTVFFEDHGYNNASKSVKIKVNP